MQNELSRENEQFLRRQKDDIIQGRKQRVPFISAIYQRLLIVYKVSYLCNFASNSSVSRKVYHF